MQLLERGKKPGALLLDGATGTNLYLRGLPEGVCVEKWILEHPEVMLDLQGGFAAAGSDAVYAPTFGLNRIKLEHYGLENELESLNIAAVELSRKAAPGCLIGGDLSPTGCFIEPYGDKTLDEIVAVYREQAAALAKAGVDFFVIETMMSLSELRAAVFACREFGKPIFATITIDENGRTLTGASPENVMVVMQELGVSACGINCSCPPAVVAPFVEKALAVAKIPVIVKPNAGMPDPNRPGHYDMTPQGMAEDMKKLVGKGVSIIGGCCGNTEAHIASMRAMLDETAVSTRALPETDEILLADESRLYRLNPDEISFSEVLACDEDLADALMDAEDDGVDCVKIAIDSLSDAESFVSEIAQVHLPVCLVSEDEKALARALYLYAGRALVETSLAFDAAKYGAVRI